MLMLLLLMTQSPPEPTIQQTPLQLLQQHLVQQSQSIGLTADTPASTESSLLIQIQALTEQLLASSAVASSISQPHSETTSNDVIFYLHFTVFGGWVVILLS